MSLVLYYFDTTKIRNTRYYFIIEMITFLVFKYLSRQRSVFIIMLRYFIKLYWSLNEDTVCATECCRRLATVDTSWWYSPRLLAPVLLLPTSHRTRVLQMAAQNFRRPRYETSKKQKSFINI